MSVDISRSYYHNTSFDRDKLRSVTEQMVNYIKKMRKAGFKVEALAFTGLSGCALAFGILSRIDIPLIYVRKDNEDSHGRPIEATPGTYESYVFIDDLISTGRTVKRVRNKLLEKGLMCEAVLSYMPSEVDPHINVPVYNLGLTWSGERIAKPTIIRNREVV